MKAPGASGGSGGSNSKIGNTARSPASKANDSKMMIDPLGRITNYSYVLRVLGPFSPRGVPRVFARARNYIRLDRPSHQFTKGKEKGWEFDGKIPNWIRSKLPAVGVGVEAGTTGGGGGSGDNEPGRCDP